MAEEEGQRYCVAPVAGMVEERAMLLTDWSKTNREELTSSEGAGKEEERDAQSVSQVLRRRIENRRLRACEDSNLHGERPRT